MRDHMDSIVLNTVALLPARRAGSSSDALKPWSVLAGSKAKQARRSLRCKPSALPVSVVFGAEPDRRGERTDVFTDPQRAAGATRCGRPRPAAG